MAYTLAKPSDDCRCGRQDDSDQDNHLSYLATVGQTVVVFSVYPFAGWLADVKWGRHRLIRWSLFLQWAGVCFQAISLSLQYTQCGLPDTLAKYVLSSAAFILITFGSAGFFANVLAYGMEQMSGAPSMALRSYINWFNWAFALGYNLYSYVEFHLLPTTDSEQYIVLGMILVVAIFFTAVLWIDVHVHKKFVNPKLLRNPYQTILGVLRFAWKHKVPLQRSALTYWEEDLPQRLDLAKTKYGGPFSHESVEDVKTTFRIIVILLSLGLFAMAYSILVLVRVPFAAHFYEGKSLDGGSAFLFSVLTSSIIIPAIPLLELVVIPLFPKLEYFLVNHLRILGVVIICLVVCALLLLTLEIIGHGLTNGEVACFLVTHSGSVSLTTYSLSLCNHSLPPPWIG